MQHANKKHKLWRTYFYESIGLKRSIKVFHRRSLMFSGHWYLSISLSIESLSTIKSPAAAGGKRECKEKKKERSTESQATETMEQIKGTINSSENGNGHAMIPLCLQQI